ncbi:MAG: thiamine pyrophosphate-binding protein [Rhizobiaceae bacterium]
MAIIPVYEALAHDLKSLGIDTIFGLVADDICHLVSALDAIGVRFIGARQETQAMMMAAGYAAASGRMGVALVGRGPASANAVHGATSASRTGFPILVIAGENPIGRGLTNAHGPDQKAFPAAAVFNALGMPTFIPTSANNARTMLADAVAEASSGKAAALLLPTDVQTAKIQIRDEDQGPSIPPSRPAEKASQSSIDAAIELLKNSKRPLIIGGVGVHRAGARGAVEALGEKLSAVMATTLKGKDLFRGNPFDIGIVGSSSTSVGRQLMEQADCVLAFGAGLNFLTTNSGTALPPVPLIQVDHVRTNIGRYSRADVGLVGDARLVAEQLAAALPQRPANDMPFRSVEVRTKIANFEHTQDFQLEHTARTVDPRKLTLDLMKVLPEDRHIVFDGGNFMANWAYVTVPDPSHFTHTVDFASVGLGIGTAIGVARGRPNSTTVLFIGDGGLLMTMGEIETVIREDLPIVIFVMNDAAYGAEVHIMKALGLPPAKAIFADVDFAPMAEVLGFTTATIRKMDDLVALEPLLSRPDGPILVDCKINMNVIAPCIAEVVPKDMID